MTRDGKHSRPMRLSDVVEGCKVEIHAYHTNGRQAQRLAELGLTPGTAVRVLQCARNQPLLVCVRGTHLAIDRRTAETLGVRVVDPMECKGSTRHGRRHRINGPRVHAARSRRRHR